MFIMKRLLYLIPIFLSLKSLGQSSAAEQNKLNHLLSKTIRIDKLKDSDALYTINIQIAVDSKGLNPVITSNNQFIFDQIEGIGILKTYNYKGMMPGTKPSKFVLPIGLLVVSSKKDGHRLKLDISNELIGMFYRLKPEDDNTQIIYLEPLVVLSDRTIYD